MGKLIKVAMSILKVTRVRFACVGVDVSLKKLAIGKICIGDSWRKEKYKGLHILCAKCDYYGHLERKCEVQSSLGNVNAGGA